MLPWQPYCSACFLCFTYPIFLILCHSVLSLILLPEVMETVPHSAAWKTGGQLRFLSFFVPILKASKCVLKKLTDLAIVSHLLSD